MMQANSKRRMAFVYSGRFPGEKAGAIFAAKSAEAFADLGYEVTLIAPRRHDRMRESPHTLYDVRKNFAVEYLPVLDLFQFPVLRKLAFFVSLATYVPSVYAYLWKHRHTFDVVYSNEAFPLLPASFVLPAVYELHDFPRRLFFFYRTLFRRVGLIVSTNEWKRSQLIERFGVPAEKILVERNAVDVSRYESITKQNARSRLGLEESVPYVIYTGQFFSWKGTDTLAEAARLLPDVSFIFVGGVDKDFARFKDRWHASANIRLVGQVPHTDVPLWQKAADVLVAPNTAKEELSAHYTSPMKVFEYMAAEVPMVVSDVPSIREIVESSAAFFARPDDPADLARAIRDALREPGDRGARALSVARNHTWMKRAERIHARLHAIG